MASQEKYNILYARLSQEDDRAGDSNSIVNQRHILEKYAKENGFENTLFLSDDGYSGTNFERPSWKKLVDMIESGTVETLIVKDMSRLGREYLQVGWYTEIYFPQKGVRFIAINDGVDSLIESSNDFNPIRNWANELHAKESSKKVRAVKKMQAERGERLGGRPPYGYRKKDADSKELVLDEETAPVVRHIFNLCASGKGPSQIARILTEEKVLTPANYYHQKYGKSHEGLDTTRPYGWSQSTITAILENKVYLGAMDGLRSTSLSYKNKKVIRKPESDHILVENTHEALITQQQWDIIQDVRAHKKRIPKKMDEPNIFSGLVFCPDCGKPLVLARASTMKRESFHYRCYTYGKRGKDACTPHRISEDDLKAIVLDDIRRTTHFARTKEREFAAYINRKNTFELRREMNALRKELTTMQKRNDELSMLFKHLYEDNVLGKVTNEQFRMLSADYNAEQKVLRDAIPEKEAHLEKLKASAVDVDEFVEMAKQYTKIDELTPEILRMFIQRIEIGERSKKGSRNAPQSIRIVYRKIGDMDRASQEPEDSSVKAEKTAVLTA